MPARENTVLQLAFDRSLVERIEAKGVWRVVGPYIASRQPLECECVAAGHRFTFKLAKSACESTGCNDCRKQISRNDPAKVIADIEAHGKVRVVGPYHGVDYSIRVQCVSCSRVYESKVWGLRNGNGCSNCGYNSRKEFTAFMADPLADAKARLAKSSLRVAIDSLSADGSIQLECRACGHRFERKATSASAKLQCPECALHKREAEAARRFRETLAIIEGFGKVRIIDRALLPGRKLRVRCTKCERVYEQGISELKKGHGCAYCADHGFSPDLPAWLYIVIVTDAKGKERTKIGITGCGPDWYRGRYVVRNRPFVKPIAAVRFETGAMAMQAEQAFKSEFAFFSHTKPVGTLHKIQATREGFLLSPAEVMRFLPHLNWQPYNDLWGA